MKRTLIFVVLLFLLVGAVSASDDIINDTGEALSVNDTTTDSMPLADDGTTPDDSTDVVGNATGEDASTPAENPTVTTSAVSGTQGKFIILKAIVKNSTGPVSGVTVTFSLNGNTYTAVSDANGIASVSVKCPASAVLKTTTKKTSTRMTKTTYYSKTYSASASINGSSSTFKVTSKKANLVKKYKVVKKTRTITAPVKKGTKIFKRGSYALVTSRASGNGIYAFAAAMAKSGQSGTIKFLASLHYKQNGKWHWTKWLKIPKNRMYQSQYPSYIKVNKIKAKYTQVSYKRIY